eukprot:2493801-Pleurochrysis_carterae.AAC.1
MLSCRALHKLALTGALTYTCLDAFQRVRRMLVPYVHERILIYRGLGFQCDRLHAVSMDAGAAAIDTTSFS